MKGHVFGVMSYLYIITGCVDPNNVFQELDYDLI